jgi:hypothetical protein
MVVLFLREKDKDERHHYRNFEFRVFATGLEEIVVRVNNAAVGMRTSPARRQNPP